MSNKESKKRRFTIFPLSIKNRLEKDAQALENNSDIEYATDPEYERAKTYRNRGREHAKAAIRDLAWFAKTQPEDQVRQVFTDELIEELMVSVLGIKAQYLELKKEELEWEQREKKGINIQENTIVLDPSILRMIFMILQVTNRAINNVLDTGTLQQLRLAMPVEHGLFDIGNIIVLQRMWGLSAYGLRDRLIDSRRKWR